MKKGEEVLTKTPLQALKNESPLAKEYPKTSSSKHILLSSILKLSKETLTKTEIENRMNSEKIPLETKYMCL